MTSIGESAFFNCDALTSITIPNSVTTIGEEAFRYCSSLASIVVENGNTNYDSRGDCNAIIETTSNTLIQGGKNTIIPNTVTSIGEYAFYDCDALTSITIPNSVTSIGEEAFLYCSALTSITCKATTPPTLGEDAFYYKLKTAYIPCGTKAAYEASDWASYSSISFVEEGCIDPTWQILYTSSDGNVVTPYKTDGFGANIVSNEYKDGQGIITFDGPVTQVGGSAFRECSSLTSVTIPNSVTKIESNAFYKCSSLTSITIPNSVKSIGVYAISHCYSLTSITIPEGVISIGVDAFTYCSSLTSITIPNSVTSIGGSAFSSCSSLTSITIPNSVTSIGSYAFYKCSSLTSITIPNSVTSIGYGVFQNCSSLTAINVDTNNPNYSSVDGVLFNKDQTTLIQHPIGNTRSEYTIPNTVTSIESWAFSKCSSLTSVTIPNSVASIGERAFFSCSSLTSITIPNSVTSIVYGTFSYCDALTSVTIPESLTSIGEEAFSSCSSLTSITCKATTPPTLGEDAFDSKLKTAYIPCGTKTAYEASDWASYITSFIEEGCIDPTWQILYTSSDGNVVTPYKTDGFGANIVSNEYKDGQGIITFDGPVTKIGNHAFNGCSSLKSISIPNSVTNIEFDAFYKCSALTLITLPESLTRIDMEAFSNCSSLTSIILPKSLKYILLSAFQGCTSLTTITIPKSVTSIGQKAFANCTSLTSIVVENGNTKYDSREDCNAIIESATNTLIAGCQNTIIPNSVTSIGSGAFQHCSSLTSITIPNSVTSIGDGAFEYCTSLTSVSLPEGVTSIGYAAFYNCFALTSITIPEGVISIEGYAFHGCSAITSISLPESLTSIGSGAFNRCSSLTSITIPEGVTSIGGYAFKFCSSLTSITSYATTPPTLGEDVFNNIDNTIPVYVPCGSISAYKADASWNYFKNFQSSEQSMLEVYSNNDTWGQVSITQPTIPYVGFTATADNSSIRMVYGGTLVGCIPDLQYSYDGQSWKKFELSTTYDVEKGKTFYMRGHNPNGVSIRFDGYSYFDMKGSFEGSGDIMTLVDSTGATTTAPDYCFYRLFRNCTSLTIAPRLTATTINYQAYVSMFSGCTKLQHIEVDFTAWSSSATESWVSSVAPTGTFVKPTALSASYGSSYIPSGWTVLDKETNDGSTSNVTSGTYECETTLILTATPNDCYQFTQWSDGNTDNPRTIVVNEDATYTAEFMPIPYTITVESADESQGSVQVEIN